MWLHAAYSSLFVTLSINVECIFFTYGTKRKQIKEMPICSVWSWESFLWIVAKLFGTPSCLLYLKKKESPLMPSHDGCLSPLPPPPPPIFTDHWLFYCILKYKKLMMKFLTHFPCSSAFLSSVSCFSFRWWWPSLRRRWECSTSSWKCLCFIILWSKWNSSC